MSPVTASILARTDLAPVFSLAFCLFSSHSTVFPVLPTSLLPTPSVTWRSAFISREISLVQKTRDFTRLRGHWSHAHDPLSEDSREHFTDGVEGAYAEASSLGSGVGPRGLPSPV